MSELTEYTVNFLKVLADQTRLQILEMLQESEQTQEDITKALEKSQSTISQQLKTLMSSDIVTYEKKDNVKNYRIKAPEVLKIIEIIKSFVVKLNKDKFTNIRDFDVLDILF